MVTLEPILIFLTLLISSGFAWPDAAPCLRTTINSMNPLEAAEHQGGLQLTNPPYTIEVNRRCYWKNQPVQCKFLRLDDNGSWQQQCFRLKNSVTHSHNEKKKVITLWWKTELDDTTVVKAQKEFWVKSVVSPPIPPCREDRTGSLAVKFVAPKPTPPPPVKKFLRNVNTVVFNELFLLTKPFSNRPVRRNSAFT
ncbi:unnamed protein product [Enterobius vermicularis]|uniref:Reelin domain-containing protein n=1 Tax=Enterobius vermicularis TaxID=51028 RepID=A0A0N4UY74_ENTVE|nr:unnamed protein product [Enterobius vermicularis]